MSHTKIPGVYEIRNTLDGKVYIGSSINTKCRMAVHRQKLARGKHDSKHLQAAWEKHGAQSFTFKLLLVCHSKDLVFYEQRLVDGYRAMEPKFGYNKRVVVQSNAGMKLSEEHKQKIADAVPRGKNHMYFGGRLSDAALKAAAEHKKINGVSEKVKDFLRVASKGVKRSAEFRKAVGDRRRGTRHSQESKEKMRLAKVGRVVTAEQKEKVGKLDYAKAQEIRALAASGVGPHSKIAEIFGVSRGRVSAILRGESWA